MCQIANMIPKPRVMFLNVLDVRAEKIVILEVCIAHKVIHDLMAGDVVPDGYSDVLKVSQQEINVLLDGRFLCEHLC